VKAIEVEKFGGPEVLRVVDVPTPTPGPGDVLLRQTVSGVNFIDVYQRTGLYPGKPPFILGREAAGVVEAVGDGVRDVRIGDRLAYPMFGRGGGYAQYNVVTATDCVPIPEGIDDRVACAAMLQGMTAHYLVTDTFALRPGMIALVHAGAGGVGNLVIQLAKQRGATVIATCGSPEKVQIAKDAGADHVIDYTKVDFAEETRRIVGDRAVDVAYDSVGKTTWERSMSLLRPRGMLVLFGNSSGPVPPIDPLRLSTAGSLFVTRPTLADYIRKRDELLTRARELFDAIARGALRVRIGGTYPLAEAAPAQRDLETRKTSGKLLLLP
jgi:NADPH2:quinone reductase